MRQDGINFINILNRFQTASQTITDIKFTKNNFLKTPIWTALYNICVTLMLKQLCITQMHFEIY
jgi:hypothetical protein